MCRSLISRLCSLTLLVVAVALAGCNMASTNSNLSGVTAFQQGNYQVADNYFRQAIQNDPANADAYYNLGANFHRMAKLQNRPIDYQQAESYYQQCLARNPNHADCYRGLAVLLAEQNRGQEAIAMVQRWGQISPQSSAPYIELARLNDEFGNKGAAQDALVQAIRNDPNNARALAALGKLREEAGDYAQATLNYQRALASNPNMPAVQQRVAALQQSMISPYGQPYQTGPNGGRVAAQPGYAPINQPPGFR
jgi:tetratricopeptide (TPR) repeat protein